MRRVGDDAGNVCEDLLGIAMTGAGYGWATASMVVPDGVGEHDPLPVEMLGTIADVAVGRSLLTTIAPPGGCRTAQLHIDVTGAPVAAAQILVARGELVARDDDLAVTAATVHDAAGSLLLRASGWLAVVPSAEEAAASQADRQRPTTASLAVLTDLLRPTDGRVQTVPEMANRFGIMHGGMQLSLLLTAMAAHGAELLGRQPRLKSVDAVLHRPVPVDQVRLEAPCRVVRSGRRVLTIAGELVGPAGKPLITGTALYGV